MICVRPILRQAINYFYFGNEGELFEYKLLGSHSSSSGMTCILDKNASLDRFSWEEFKAQIDEKMKRGEMGRYTIWCPPKPFLFVGLLEQSYGLDGALVYALPGRSPCVRAARGLLIQSFYESFDD